MQPHDRRSLWQLTQRGGLPPRRAISDARRHVALADFRQGSSLGIATEALRARSVLIACNRQLPALLAMMQLDGVARRILLCPPDLAPRYLPAVIAQAEVDAIVTDGSLAAQAGPTLIIAHDTLSQAESTSDRSQPTEWLLFTSGTTGLPKIVIHTLPSLTGPVEEGPSPAGNAVWSTFYDVRRYGGLQILLRALLGGGSLVLSQAGEPVADFLARAGQCGVTHMSGTPSHWRRALISGAANRMAPRYIRLSGEVVDQPVLDALAVAFPDAEIAHAFASTEAGVGFEVHDRLAGFPAAMLDQPGSNVALRVRDGSLWISSPRTASSYLGGDKSLLGAGGFVDTGDMVTLRAGRYYFAGRRDGTINVGGQKVHPEEVEAIINAHPDVRMSRVRGQSNRITGELVVAEIVLRPSGAQRPADRLDHEIREVCQQALPLHKVPAILRVVPSLELTEGGKLSRHIA